MLIDFAVHADLWSKALQQGKLAGLLNLLKSWMETCAQSLGLNCTGVWLLLWKRAATAQDFLLQNQPIFFFKALPQFYGKEDTFLPL